jgi:hypothetical protein
LILYFRSRNRLVTTGFLLAVFLFACFVFGVLSVRRTTEGTFLIAVLFCAIVYWVKPEAMVGVALFAAFAALPQGLFIGKQIGPAVISAYLVAAVLAVCYLSSIVRSRFSDYLLPGILALTIVFTAAAGFQAGSEPRVIWVEALSMFEIVVGFLLALLVVYGGYISWCMRVAVVILWFSAAMAIMSSLREIRLAGRAESVEGGGSDSAVRIIVTTQIPATAVLCALVAAVIVGSVRPATVLRLGPPALIISLLSFSRNTLIAIAVAAGVAFLISLSWSAVRRTAVVGAVSVAVLAVAVPGSLFLLGHSQAGAWLSAQFSAFNQRVLGGVSSSALAVDESALERVRENGLLYREIARAPLFGHGLGYPYQAPKGGDEFGLIFYPAYSHNFYLWWLAKTGLGGMAVFALFALTPLVRAIRGASAPAKISAAVSAGLLAISVVWPLPEMGPDALALGLALGLTMGFGNARTMGQEPGVERAPAMVGTSGSH